MKTAVSIPENLFQVAEEAARQLRMSRSQLYTAAIEEFLQRRQDRTITERLDEVYRDTPAGLDRSFEIAQFKSIEKSSEKDSW